MLAKEGFNSIREMGKEKSLGQSPPVGEAKELASAEESPGEVLRHSDRWD